MGLLRASLYPASQVKTQILLEMLLDGVDEERANVLTDGPDGWNTVEILCHLRDFEQVWQERMRLVLAEERPLLPAFPHDQLAIDNDYKHQNYAAVRAERAALRAESQALIESVTNEQWERIGMHREFGPLTLAELRFQIVLHDLDHLEQLARVLGDVRQ